MGRVHATYVKRRKLLRSPIVPKLWYSTEIFAALLNSEARARVDSGEVRFNCSPRPFDTLIVT